MEKERRHGPAPAVIVVGASKEAVAREAREILRRDGHEIAVSTSPEALLAGFDPARIDLVVLAFEGMDSDDFALCRKLRARSDAHPVKILVAGEGDDEDRIARAYQAGADDWIPSPIEWPLFRLRTRALLRSDDRLVALNRRFARMEDAQRIAQVGSWELDVDSHDMRWSAETYRILGLKPSGDKTSFEIFSMFVHPEEHVPVMEQILAAAQAGQPLNLSYRVVLASGTLRHVQLRGEFLSEKGRGKLYGTIQDITEQRQSQEEIGRLAHFDSLTGLANRRRFMEQLKRSIERARFMGRHMALLYMDLDQFKRINDTLGHSAGDRLLEHVAKVLFEVVRTTDLIARTLNEDGEIEVSRVGGDEFAILLSEISTLADAGLVAQRILDAITTPITFEEHQISTTASIGIAIFPEDGENVESLIKDADIAMYKAKERGRNIYEYFSETMNEGLLRKLTLETHLRHALERGELRVVYQPRINLRERRIAGLEALLRWDSAELGPVSPKDFIPVAEDTGLIVPIGEWVLQTACAQAEAWRAAGHPKLCVSVNVSSRQFVHHDIRKTVVQVLKSTGLAPHRLELEITESVLLEDDPTTVETLREISAMGVAIALDDFGTGYSSMGYLTRLPLDTLKLDLSLVRNVGSDPTARGMAKALIAMAHAVNLSVTAEGVDHIDQARFLEEEGCDEVQGFLISGAVSPEECARFLTEPEPLLSVLGWDAPAEGAAELPSAQAQASPNRESDLPAPKPRKRPARDGSRRPRRGKSRPSG